ncbi:MAG: hypothetical protein ACBZ72_07080 [Candidatus Bathyarchaeia archaeon]|jgi:hypothetical protein
MDYPSISQIVYRDSVGLSVSVEVTVWLPNVPIVESRLSARPVGATVWSTLAPAAN